MAKTVTGTDLQTGTRPKRSCRRELIEIQKSIVDSLKTEIQVSIGKATKESEAYLAEYHEEFKRYQRLSSMAELMESVRHADIVYNGDYHTLAQAQRTPLRILREVVSQRPQITLAVEVIRIDHQAELDRFMAGELSEDDFLRAIDYDETWGFPWDHYRDLFVFAQDHNIRVIGINTEPKRGRWVLKKRDLTAARVIAREYLERPDNLVYVFDGDLHVAPPHLPSAVNTLLAGFGVRPRTVIVYQNSERIYWELARKGLEQETNVVLISKGRHCIMNTPPIIKFQSYLNWIDNTRELTSPAPRSWHVELAGGEDLYSQVLRLVRMISQFLRIDAEGLDDFVVYSPADLDFLDHLREKSGLTRDEIRTIAEHIGYNESYFIEDGNIIYIANLSINHAAEEATHFIHTVCAGEKRKNLGQAEDFYCRVMREAIGFFGSKIVNHKRPCYRLDDLRNPRRRFPNKPPERIEELKTIGKYVRMHQKYEQSFLSNGLPWDLKGPIYELPLRIHVGITHVLGYILGNRLFESLMNAETDKDTIRNLFFLNFSKLSESLTTYLDLISTLR